MRDVEPQPADSPRSARDARRLVAWAIVIGFVLGAGVALRLWPPRVVKEATSSPSESAIAEAIDEPAADWCAPSFEPIAGGGCFAPAVGGGRADALVVYLHGRYARDASADEVDRQKRLAQKAGARGFAVLALRGRLGVCTAPELAAWYCWPSNEHNADLADQFVSGWTKALNAAHARSGAASRVLLGFSNGGYFAGLLASRGLLPVTAVVVAHGGPVEPVRAVRRAPPLLLLSADDDVAQDDMMRFDDDLSREGWAHDSYARSGAHGLADEDIDAALAFFARVGEPLPLSPPLPLHRAVRHARDAGLAPEMPEIAEAGDSAPNADAVYEPLEQPLELDPPDAGSLNAAAQPSAAIPPVETDPNASPQADSHGADPAR